MRRHSYQGRGKGNIEHYPSPQRDNLTSGLVSISKQFDLSAKYIHFLSVITSLECMLTFGEITPKECMI